MKCSNPLCNRGIGLISHRRGWFCKRRYCSRKCRDAFVTDLPKWSTQEHNASAYFGWLFVQLPAQKSMQAVIRVKARYGDKI
jgi:hypothetical protein